LRVPTELEASMLVIGDELLAGYVEDRNTPWLAERLRAHGVPLTRVHMIPDTFEAIDEALRAELARSRPRLVFTSGGLGSTPDDVTFEAVAASLGREVVADPVLAARMDEIARRTSAHGVEVDEVFRRHLGRMARVPEGSRVLDPQGRWIPSAVVDVDGGVDMPGGASIVILPGVPAAFRSLFEEVVAPTMVAGRRVPPTVEEIEHELPESLLNAAFVRLLETRPEVRLGSYPGRPMIVRLTGPPDAVAAAADEIREAIEAITRTDAGARLVAAWRERRRREDPS
jgi:molybdenum cofactor synthesis domain-containing protein